MFNAIFFSFTYIDSDGNRKLCNFPSWPETLPGKNNSIFFFGVKNNLFPFLIISTYQSAVDSIKYNFGLDIPFRVIFQTGKIVAEDEEAWEELS